MSAKYSDYTFDKFNEEFPYEEMILNKILNGKTFLFKFSPNKQEVKIEFIDKCHYYLNTGDFYKLLIITVKLVGLNPIKVKKREYPNFPNDGSL